MILSSWICEENFNLNALFNDQQCCAKEKNDDTSNSGIESNAQNHKEHIYNEHYQNFPKINFNLQKNSKFRINKIATAKETKNPNEEATFHVKENPNILDDTFNTLPLLFQNTAKKWILTSQI